MSSVAIQGNAAGTGVFTIASPNSASSYTATLPTATTTLVGTDATQTLTNKTIQGGAITSGTAVASTSGTSIDFTSIPSWVKRIVIMYSGVSTSATANWQIQLGTGATPTYTTSGYASTMIVASVGAATVSNASTGFVHTAPNVASQITSGQITLYNQTGNIWVSQGAVGASVATRSYVHSGSLSLGNVLTAFRITTTSTDTFNAGSINILYE